jgi:S1-C subfamily serine protease
MLRFACPSCQTALQVPDDKAGTVTACPRCRQGLRVPLPAAAASAAPAASGSVRIPAPGAGTPAAEEAVWFFIQAGDKKGPVSWPQLRQLAATAHLLPSDLVWTNPMVQAVPARSVRGLCPEAPAPAPPEPLSALVPDVSADKAPVAREGPPLWKRLLRECRETATATARQTVRPILYLRSLLRGRSLRRRARAVRLTLGQQLYQAQAGDPEVREQVRVLGERIHGAEGDKAVTRKLGQERHALLEGLADEALARDGAPPSAAAALQRARDAQARWQTHQEQTRAARHNLLPSGGAGWLRVGAGYGFVAAAVALFLWLLPAGSEPAPTPAADAARAGAPGPLPDLTTEEIYARYAKAVALIRSDKTSGTGFLVRPGVLATNAHVIDFALIPQLRVYFPSAGEAGKTPRAVKLLYYNRARDLALLEVDFPQAPLTVSTTYRFQGGQRVTVIGNPNIKDLTLENAVGQGLMSTRTQIRGQNFYQLSLAVNPGNSGGPAFDAKGQVIGVVTLKAKEKEAIAFCVPADDLTRALADVDRQPPARRAEAAARHRLEVVFHRVALAGAIYDKGMELYARCMREALRNRLPVSAGVAAARKLFREKFKDPDKEILADVKEEITRLSSDPQLPEETRQKLTELWATCQEFKSYVENPRGTFRGYVLKYNELEAKMKRLVEALRSTLGLEESD